MPLVARTLPSVEQDPELKKQFEVPFQVLPPELEGAFDCPDYMEKNLFDRVRDLFRRDVITFVEEDTDTLPERRSFLRRLFNRQQITFG